jgi:hypothetical protein
MGAIENDMTKTSMNTDNFRKASGDLGNLIIFRTYLVRACMGMHDVCTYLNIAQ